MRVCWKGVSHRMDDVVLVVQKSGIFAFFSPKKEAIGRCFFVISFIMLSICIYKCDFLKLKLLNLLENIIVHADFR